ncbi:MAG: nitrate/nitrite transporter NrtS [Gammaproteobacteria bacterium]|nr:nitrate/nitrite transporter NrtS [Gammaproteobacteria bacterium]
MRDWFDIALQRSVAARALKVAAFVGCILALINHGDKLLSGSVTLTEWVKIGLTFLVPYCVSTFASVQAIRHLHGRTAPAVEPGDDAA